MSHGKAVRTARWKYGEYTYFPEMSGRYDLEKDAYEMKNLYKDPAAKAEAEKLQAELKRPDSEIRWS